MKAYLNLLKKYLVATLFIAIVTSCVKNFEPSVNYPSPLPDSVPLRFMPGIVSSDSLDFNAEFSNDGNTFYFCRSKKGKWEINEMSLSSGDTSKIKRSSFSETAYSQADPFMTSDGTMYYISNRPQSATDTFPDYNIWRVYPTENGEWTTPELVEGVNTDSTEYYVSISSNGTIYFASNRSGGYGGLDLYYSKLINGKYTTPENLGPAINTSTDEHDPLIIDDEAFIIFTSSGRADSFGEADLYYSKKQSNGWDKAQNLGSRFNTPTYEYCPNFSPDFKYFFYSSEYDVKWIKSEYLPFRMKKQDSETSF